jgi:hypothetical protein
MGSGQGILPVPLHVGHTAGFFSALDVSAGAAWFGCAAFTGGEASSVFAPFAFGVLTGAKYSHAKSKPPMMITNISMPFMIYLRLGISTNNPTFGIRYIGKQECQMKRRMIFS